MFSLAKTRSKAKAWVVSHEPSKHKAHAVFKRPEATLRFSSPCGKVSWLITGMRSLLTATWSHW